jgi:hypothetical protein
MIDWLCFLLVMRCPFYWPTKSVWLWMIARAGRYAFPTFDPEAFDKMTRKGREAWKDVPDASKWVDELRGGAGD